jgi:hypothetical protein
MCGVLSSSGGGGAKGSIVTVLCILNLWTNGPIIRREPTADGHSRREPTTMFQVTGGESLGEQREREIEREGGRPGVRHKLAARSPRG